MPRTWDGRFARFLVRPLVGSPVTPNHLTTLRLAIGVAGAAALAHGGYGWINVGALLVALSNFVDHTDGELARISGQSSRFGHFYDLACDAVVTILLFTGMGVGVAAAQSFSSITPVVLGSLTGVAVAAIFFLRMRIADLLGQVRVGQSFVAGFETEDVLYLLPLVTLFDVASGFLVVASIGSSIYALRQLFDYARVVRHPPSDVIGSS